jgi:hypothetical protein
MRKLNTEELTLVYGGGKKPCHPKPPKCKPPKRGSSSSDSRDGGGKGRGKSSSS